MQTQGRKERNKAFAAVRGYLKNLMNREKYIIVWVKPYDTSRIALGILRKT